MKIAIVGLSTPRPHHWAELFKGRDVEIACVWDYDHNKADIFCREFGGAVVDDIETIADEGLDGTAVFSRVEDHAGHALPFIAGGVPTYIDEPMVSTPADLDRVMEAVREHVTPIMTPSVLQCPDDTPADSSECDASLVETFLWMCESCESPLSIDEVDRQIRKSLEGV